MSTLIPGQHYIFQVAGSVALSTRGIEVSKWKAESSVRVAYFKMRSSFPRHVQVVAGARQLNDQSTVWLL